MSHSYSLGGSSNKAVHCQYYSMLTYSVCGTSRRQTGYIYMFISLIAVARTLETGMQFHPTPPNTNPNQTDPNPTDSTKPYTFTTTLFPNKLSYIYTYYTVSYTHLTLPTIYSV